MAYDGSIKIDTKIDTGGFSGGINKMKSIASKGAAAISASLTAVSTAVIGGGTAAVKVGSSFESAMDKVSAISGSTGDDLAALTDKAKKMGATTKFSATESAEALQYMAMAGWKTKDMLDGVSGVMSLAAADGLDLATTSDIVTDALTAFGLRAKDSTHFADVLAKASSSANTNVSMLGESFKYVAPLAGTMGYSVEDVSVALGLMANASVKGSMAGTSLKTALANLSAPTKNMKQVMDQYKLSMTDANGKALPLIDVIKELREKFSDLSESEQTAAASTLFGKEAMSGMLAIINASDSDFTKLIDNITHADGAAESMAETMQDNLQGQITILKSSLEGLGIELYSGLQEPLKNAAVEAQGYVNRLTAAFQDGGLTFMIEEAGNVFGELAVKAAEHAPEMVEAAFSFLQSFIQGIASNSDKLVESAKKIVSTIVDNLVKLLPSEVQKPVKEAVETIKKSFQNGGLRTAINTVKNTIRNLGKVITNIAKVVIPPLSKAIDFLAGRTKILLPIAVSLFTAYKAYKIISAATAAIQAHRIAVTAEALAEAASTGAITLKQIAVGLLTGEISLATAAQYAWNLAMSLNPIGMVVAAVAALAGGIAALCLTMGEVEEETVIFDNVLESTLDNAQSKIAETNEAIGKSYKTIGEKFSDFLNEIDGAGSILDGFNESIIISDEKRQEITDNMDSVQSEITEICSLAAEERRELTGGEIQRLNELFQKMHELADQELAIEQAKQNVVSTAAEDLASSAEIGLEEYTERSQKIANTAEETRSAVISKAEEQYYEELALLEQEYNTKSDYSKEQYEHDRQAAKADYDAAVNEANRKAGDTLKILAEGYKERAVLLRNNSGALGSINAESENEEKRHEAALQKIKEDALKKAREISGKDADENLLRHHENVELNKAQMKITTENLQHTLNSLSIRNKQQQILNDKNYQNQLIAFTSLSGLYETYAGETLESSRYIVDAFFQPMENMPEDTREVFMQNMNGAIKGLESKESTLYWKAAEIANGFIGTFKSMFQQNSPSKVFKRLFRYNIEGAEEGTVNESRKLYQTADTVSNTFTKRLNAGISADGLVAKLRTGIAEGKAMVTQALTAKVVHHVNLNAEEANRKMVLRGDVVSHISIDGREFAVVSAPYVSEELQWNGGMT